MRLRRTLGSPALVALSQVPIAATAYFALGLVGQRSAGLTWVVFAAASGFFLLCVMTYVEGSSLHQERGGATIFARYGFNELWSFVAGWAIVLDYLILVAITAYTTTDYLGGLWPAASEGAPERVIALAVIGYVAAVHVRGVRAQAFERLSVLVLADALVLVALLAAGLVMLADASTLTDPLSLGRPAATDVLFAFTLVAVAATGLDAASGLAGEVRIGRRGLRRLVTVQVAGTLPYVALAAVATAVLPRITGEAGVEAPVLGVARALDDGVLRDALVALVSLSAVAVLAVACHVAMLGLSRIGYSLALNRQIPSAVGRLHPTRSTPVVVIGIGAVLAALLTLPADLDFLAGLYAFGAMLALTIAHAAVVASRYREPDRDRPYRMPGNVSVGRGDLPLPAVLGGLLALASFLSVLLLHDAARIAGTLWMAFGVTLYVVYRRTEGKPLLKRITVPEKALARLPEAPAAYGSILVPVFGRPLDVDIVQTAGRLAAEVRLDEGEEGAMIEAVWVFEVPMALGLDGRLPDEELRRARAALARAKEIGEEYEGVQVATATVRARRAGEAIVQEARRRGVDAIVLAAEPPSRIRGGALLGGLGGPADSTVGDATRYVIGNAPCRVVLTAAPADDAGGGGRRAEPAPGQKAGATDQRPARLRPPDDPAAAPAPEEPKKRPYRPPPRPRRRPR